MLDPTTKTTGRFEPLHLFFTNKGRISRQQYLLGWTILMVLYFPIASLFQFMSQIIPFENTWVISQVAFMALFIIPHFFIMTKRLHDFNTSGLFTLFILIPLLGQLIALPILILMSMFIKGTVGSNKHNQESNLLKFKPQYCNNCGSPLKQSSTFCPSCGKNLAH